MVIRLQAAVSHHNSVYHIQLAIYFPQMVPVIVMTDFLGRFFPPVLISGKEMKMGINYFHRIFPFFGGQPFFCPLL